MEKIPEHKALNLMDLANYHVDLLLKMEEQGLLPPGMLQKARESEEFKAAAPESWAELDKRLKEKDKAPQDKE